MIPTRATAILVAAGLAAAAAVRPATAQVPATSLGLGLPVPAVDARTAALGGTGLGLADGSLSARNPADIALFDHPVLGITYAPEDATVRGSGREAGTGRSRISVLRGAVPVRDWAFGLSFASELDQDWQVRFSDTLTVEDGTFPFTEQRTHDGGLSSVNLTAARRMGRRLTLGAEYSVLTGAVRQSYRRDFEADVGDPNTVLGPASGRAEWSYSGHRIKVGATAHVNPRLNVGADFSVGGDLTAERDSADRIVRRRAYSMPMLLDVGATYRVSPRLLLLGAGGWAGWEKTDTGAIDFESSDIVWGGVGAELTGTRLLGLQVPLRAGFRYAQLPFHAPGADQLTELAGTLGFGVRVAQDRARFDLALEIGSRGDEAASGLEESFQRLSITFALFQN